MGVIFGFLKLVPPWVWILAGLIAWGGWQKHRADSSAARLQGAIVQASQQRESKLRNDLKETERRVLVQSEIMNESAIQASVANARAAAAASAVRGLQHDLSTLRARLAAGDSPTAAASAADTTADLLGQCAERYSSVAAEADRAIIAGQACQRAYDSLKGTEHVDH